MSYLEEVEAHNEQLLKANEQLAKELHWISLLHKFKKDYEYYLHFQNGYTVHRMPLAKQMFKDSVRSFLQYKNEPNNFEKIIQSLEPSFLKLLQPQDNLKYISFGIEYKKVDVVLCHQLIFLLQDSNTIQYVKHHNLTSDFQFSGWAL